MAYTTSQAFSPRGTTMAFNDGNSPVTNGFLAEVKKIQFTGQKYDLADVTNFESGNFREWLPTLADSGDLTFECNYIPGDASQTSLRTLFNSAVLTAWTITLPNSLGTITFSAYVQSIDIDLPIDKEAMLTGKLKITGRISGI